MQNRLLYFVAVLVVLVLLVATTVALGPPSDLFDRRVETSSVDGNDTEVAQTPDTDRWFVDVSSERGLENLTGNFEVRGGREGEVTPGVYVADYNNNSFPDILAIPGERPVLYENTGGEYTLSDSLPQINRKVETAHFFDYDNDGWVDLYLLSNEGSVFLENEQGEFVKRRVGLEHSYRSVRGATTADYTGNGCLDVFVIQAADWSKKRPAGYNDRNVSISQDNGNQNRLFAGNCDSFTEATEEAGITGEAWSLATSFVDFTNDGYPDIHIANDFNNDVLYLNNGDGTFERRVMSNVTNRNSMSSEVADINNDGYSDIFVTNIHYNGTRAGANRYDGRIRGNNLLINNGNGTFTDKADEYGVKEGGWGWAAIIEDFNNDNQLDIFQADSGSASPEYPIFWTGYKNRSARLEPSKLGLNKSLEYGVAKLDYNMDGRVDILTSNATGPFRLYENTAESGGYLNILLQDGDHTTVGSCVTVESNVTKQKCKMANSDYLSQSSQMIHFAVSEEVDTVKLTVDWVSGRSSTFENVPVNRSYTVNPNGVAGVR